MQDLYHHPYYDPVPPYTQNLINTTPKPLNPPSFALPEATRSEQHEYSTHTDP